MYNSPQNICQYLPPTVIGPHSDITNHMKTGRYKSHEEASASASKVSGGFKKTMPEFDGLTPVAANGASTHHSANHDFSFRSSNSFFFLMDQVTLILN